MPVITKRLLDSIKADGKLHIIADDDLPGFAIQVTSAGTISFCITYRIGGKNKRRVIGRYGPLTVEAARKQARAELGRAANGEDPRPRQTDEIATIEDLFSAWMERHVDVHLKPNTRRYYRDVYSAQCRVRFSHLKPHQLTFAAISEVHQELKDTPVMANRVVRVMRAMLIWAEDQRILRFKDGNPARGHRRYKETASDRFLSVPELRAFITELPRSPISPNSQAALMLQLLLARRSVELVSIRKGDINLDTAVWTIPAKVMKSNTVHHVPLPPWSRRIIADLISSARGAYLFASQIGDPTADAAVPIEPHALGKALRRAQRQPGDPRDDTRRIWVYDFRDAHGEPNPFSPHDLRRTCSEYLRQLGHDDFVRKAILDHADSRDVTATHYSPGELLRLKRTALLDWEVAVRQIVDGKDPFYSSIEDDRAEEARKLSVVDPDTAPLPIDTLALARAQRRQGS